MPIYDKVGKPIKIIGQNQSDGGIQFLEMDKDGNITGIFSNKGSGKNVSKGTWYSPVKKEFLSLEIKKTPIENNQYHEIRPKRTKDIIGKYHYEYGKEGHFGTLNVYAIEDDQITLDLLCVTAEPSRNIASIEEKITLPIVNHTAYIDWSENCHFTIRFFDGFAVIDYRVDKDDCDFGHNAHVEGIFLKIK